MKQIKTVILVVYSVLGFGLLSIPFSNIDKSDGHMVVEYGLPFRWFTVHHGLTEENAHSSSMQWWVVKNRSFSFPGFISDLTIAALAGVALTSVTVRVHNWMSVYRHKHALHG